MATLNQVILIGNLGRDPELRTFANGGKICNLSVATSRSYKGKDGQWVNNTDWHTVVIQTPQLAEAVANKLHKGDIVHVNGELRTRKWQDQSGADRYTTEVIVGGYTGQVQKIAEAGGKQSNKQSNDDAGSYDEPQSTSNDLDDDIPF